MTSLRLPMSILVVVALQSACMPALHSASEKGDVEAVRALLDKGADVNELTDNYIYVSALMWASVEGRAEVVKLLIERDAKVDQVSWQGMVALGFAAQYNHEDVANSLIENGADIDRAIEGMERARSCQYRGAIRAECKSGIRMLNRLKARRLSTRSGERPALGQAAADPATGNAQRAVVAVFDIEVKGLELDPGTLDRLVDWLCTLLTRRRYQVVPRSQLKQRIQAQKTESYKACYEESCQIEIGKELAAEKSLSTQVLKLGEKCKVSLTLFDLKRSASERAGQGEGLCTEDGVVKALEAAVKDMAD